MFEDMLGIKHFSGFISPGCVPQIITGVSCDVQLI